VSDSTIGVVRAVPLNLRMNGCRLRLNLVKLNLGLLETAAELGRYWTRENQSRDKH